MVVAVAVLFLLLLLPADESRYRSSSEAHGPRFAVCNVENTDDSRQFFCKPLLSHYARYFACEAYVFSGVEVASLPDDASWICV